MQLTTCRNIDELCIGTSPCEMSDFRIFRQIWRSTFATIVCCSQHVKLLTNSVSARHWAKCPIFGHFAYSLVDVVEKMFYQPDCFSAKNYQNFFFERIIYHNCLLLKTRRNIDELSIGTSPSKCPIVLALKCMKTVLSSKLFITIVCCSQHVEIYTKSVSARHQASPSSALDVVETKKAINQIVLALKDINTDFLSKLFITIVCCSQHVEILTNCASARHRAKCPIFGFFAKFGG